MKHIFIACLSALVAPVLAAEALLPGQFSEAVPIAIEANRPLQQLALPDAVYQRAVSPDLYDLAVFDAQGLRVPHVLCTVPQQQHLAELLNTLTVFPVQLARNGGGQGATAEVRTDGGDRIAITVPGSTPQTAVGVTAYELDLSVLNPATVALQVQWHSPTGLSEVHFKVEQAEGRQPWRTVVEDAALRRLSADGQTLEWAEISLPPAHYQSLRLTPRDASGTVIDGVQARTRETTLLPADLHWFPALQTGPADEPAPFKGKTQSYDARRQAPVIAARITLVEPNTRFDLRLQSRPSLEARWQTAWAGEAFYLLTPGGERRSAEIVLPANRDRYWRLLAEDASAPFTPILELGYTPQNLRFVAQGQGPYRLAYGNASTNMQGPTTSCEGLLKTLLKQPGSDEAAQLMGSAEAGAVQVLAGAAALQAPPPQTAPAWRRWLLWAVLITAVLLLLGMARTLLADLKKPTEDKQAP
jgi:hypothetical protein